ncbi:uncharacterized protein LOC116851306 [Odontomachus brunneus]|uniref:uncharacterized protein LOC116851306 n=1 Tax=Odontomachus brunneus TaxID=486640 RepID=UPI0013F21154|nr:uncharacterized protein LOC116851306 [Odontomachus brunneus]
MSFYDNYYYRINKLLLSMIGQWPYQSRLKATLMLAVMSFFLCTITILEFWSLLAGITDLSIIMENTPIFLVCVAVISKLGNFIVNKDKMKKLLDYIEKDWNMMQAGPRNKILQLYAEQSRILTIRYALIFYAAWFCYCMMPFVFTGLYLLLPTNETYPQKFLFRLEHVLDIDKYYNLLMIHAFVSLFFAISLPIAIDSMFIVCIQHVCALFEIIRYNMKNIGKSDYVILKPNIADDHAYHIIKHCIKVYNHSADYSCNWYTISLRSRRLLLFTLLRTMKPCQIRAARCKMSFYDNCYYHINKLLLSITGQWPYQSRLEATVMLAVVSFFLCTFTILEFWSLIAGITDLSILMENTPPFLVCVAVISKLGNFIVNKDKMKKLLDYIEKDWNMMQAGPRNKILQLYAEQSRILTIRYALIFYAAWFCYCTMPFVFTGLYLLLPTNETYPQKFLFRLEHVLDMDKYYNLLMIHGFVSVFFVVSLPIAIDGMFIVCIQHVCALFEIIRYNMKNIGESDYVILKPNITDDHAYHIIKHCIKVYNHSAEFSALLSSSFAASFFFLLGIVIINLSFSAAELIMVDIQMDDCIRIIAANVAQFVHIYYLSLLSQQLIDYSSGLHEVMYVPTDIMAGVFPVIKYRYYYLNKFTLCAIGQWPYQKRLEANTMFAITLFMFGSLTALEFLGLIKGITNLSIIMENTTPLLVNGFLFVKLINFYFQKSKMKELLVYIEEHWKIMSSGPQNEILRSYAEQSKVWLIRYAMSLYLLGHFYSLMPYAVSGIYWFLPNVTYSARFLYRLEHVFDIEKYFHLLVFHLYIGLMFMLTVAIAVDSMFLMCIQHVCALFEIIRYNIEHIQEPDVIILRPHIEYDKPYQVIINCIKIYNSAYEFSELLSSSFEMSYFFLLGNVILSLSFCMAEVNIRQAEKAETLVFSFHLINKYLLFKMIMVDVQLDEVIRILANSVGQLVHIYYISFISQRLIDYSSELHEVIYSCNWYTTSIRSRQLLQLTLLRAMKPCKIKAGKIYVLSMENFSSIIQVSLSYFTMLTSLQ